jgi:septal ring factor EnvC (AmiA/AmiB activator)
MRALRILRTYTMRRRREGQAMRFKLIGFVLCAMFAAPGFAQDQTLRDTVPSIDAVRSRLHLTPQQEERLRPMFRQREQQLQETRSKLELATSSTEKSQVMRAAKADAQAFNAQVESVLDAAQKGDWRDLRDETREKVKEGYERKHETRP